MAPGPSKPAMAAKLAESKRKRTTVTHDEPNANGVDPGGDEAGEHDPNSQPPELDEHQAPSKVYGSKRQKKTDTGDTATKTRAVTKKMQKKPFPFLSLPPELRNKIYEYVLLDSDPITPVPRRKGRLTRDKRAPEWYSRHFKDRTYGSSFVAPRILRLNRQVHNEARPFLYRNDIVLDRVGDLNVFLLSIGPENRALLRSVTVCYWWSRSTLCNVHPNEVALSLLGDCQDLTRLRLVVTGNLDRITKEIGLRGNRFLWSHAASKGKKDAALDILQFGALKCYCFGRPQKKIAEEIEEGKKFDKRAKEMLQQYLLKK